MKVEKDTGKFLTAEDVRDGDLITIMGEGQEEEGEYGIKLQLPIKLPSGDEKIVSLNATSKNNLIDAYGDETANWVLKQACVNVTQQLIKKVLKKTVIFTAPGLDLEGKPRK